MKQVPMRSLDGLLAYCETLTDGDKSNLRALVSLNNVDQLRELADKGIKNGHSRFIEVAIFLRKLYELQVY